MVFKQGEHWACRQRKPNLGGEYFHTATLNEDKMMDAVDRILNFLSRENVSIRDAQWILDVAKEQMMDHRFIVNQEIPNMDNVLDAIAGKWSCMSVKDKDVILDVLCSQGVDSAGSMVEAIKKKGECGSVSSLLVSM